ncbi:MAG: hypothetical protein KBA61_10210 [Spirochaetes bacterium]|nr:hypothetical protein [Spirochaetota bacterium]
MYTHTTDRVREMLGFTSRFMGGWAMGMVVFGIVGKILTFYFALKYAIWFWKGILGG